MLISLSLRTKKGKISEKIRIGMGSTNQIHCYQTFFGEHSATLDRTDNLLTITIIYPGK